MTGMPSFREKVTLRGILAQPDAECLSRTRAFARRQFHQPAPFVCTAIVIQRRLLDLDVGAFAVYSRVITC